MRRVCLPLLLCLGFVSQRLAAQEAVSFVRDIKPLLKERCCSCHGSLKQKGDLRLDTVALMKEGGKSGPALVPGHADKSLLIERMTASDPAKRMPPRNEAEQLSAQQIARIKAWIDQGAKAPAVEKAEADPRLHWAFRVPVRAALPVSKRPEWNRNPIDAFIAAEHDKHGLKPEPPVERELLLRRVYLDLIGLPPTAAELHAFLADTSPTAYEKVVDQLLARPQYGERWARHWMDVWRYSDWYGRRSVADVRNSAPQIWRWRDWIIKSINDDRGYDRMVQEMLAADEIAPEDDDAAAATGFIVRNWYSLNPHQWMRDMVEHTGKAFLGLTFNCCHCHDHKYDPISQEEYFGMRAFFEPLGVRQDRVPGEPDPGPFKKYDYGDTRKAITVGMVRAYDETLDAKTFLYQQGDERLKPPGKAPIPPMVPAFLDGKKLRIEPVSLPTTLLHPGLKPWLQREELAQKEKSLATARDALAKAGSDKESARLQADIAEAQLETARTVFAAENVKHGKQPGNFAELARAASKSERKLAWLLARDKQIKAEAALPLARKKLAEAAAGKAKDAAGAGLKKVEKLASDAGQALAKAVKGLNADTQQYSPPGGAVYPPTSTGRRKALALWITRRDNPLAARVAVNHIWLRHFDRALVDTVFDLGRNGKRPSHPELLDWLAVEFMESGWSMKKLHRLIVTSQTYRMRSGGAASDRDPDNHYLARFPSRRMEAETVRDTLLYLGGELDLKMGGPPIENEDEAKSKRRGMYFSVYPEDGGSARFLEIFDAPDPCDCYKRTASVIPQQALALTNNQLAVNQSRLLARKLSQSIPGMKDESAFIQVAFEQVLCRRATSEEENLCQGFLKQQADLFRKTGGKALAVPPAAGTVPPSTEPMLRAREGLVRTLFSHNDFVTIR